MKYPFLQAGSLVLLLIITDLIQARDVYMEPSTFISDSFDGRPPDSQSIWISGDLKTGIRKIMGHDPGVLRMRYWERDRRTVWILEEIGKEQPITTGFVVNQGEIERVKVLIYRETRGWEVRYPFFTDQFKRSELDEDRQLDRNIDGISGATLSVNALEKLARLALFLHGRVQEKTREDVAGK